MKSTTNNPVKSLIKACIFIVAMLLMALIFGCSIVEPPTWNNLIINFEEENPNKLSITHNKNNGFKTVENGDDYYVHFETWNNDLGEKMFRLTYSGEFEFHIPHFNGFWNYRYTSKGDLIEDNDMELNFEYKTNKSFALEGRLKERETYEIFLSKKTK